LYEERGLDFVDSLDGMFGLALWDARRGRLVLARDRLGEKPLYYATTSDGFLFASEPKALLASGAVSSTPDWDALALYLRTGFVPAPASAFRDVVKLPPGGRLVLEGGGLAVDRYWQVAPLLAAPPLALGLEAAAEALRAHLARAVRAALVSDVPLGVFLSGGLDSTAIAALARPAVDGELATFALGFDVAGFDEPQHAAVAARAPRPATPPCASCSRGFSRRQRCRPPPGIAPGPAASTPSCSPRSPHPAVRSGYRRNRRRRRPAARWTRCSRSISPATWPTISSRSSTAPPWPPRSRAAPPTWITTWWSSRAGSRRR